MRRWVERILPGKPIPQRGGQPGVQEVRLPFADVEGSLALYVTALSNGTLRISGTAGASSGSYSDGRTIFFPIDVRGFETRPTHAGSTG